MGEQEGDHVSPDHTIESRGTIRDLHRHLRAQQSFSVVSGAYHLQGCHCPHESFSRHARDSDDLQLELIPLFEVEVDQLAPDSLDLLGQNCCDCGHRIHI